MRAAEELKVKPKHNNATAAQCLRIMERAGCLGVHPLPPQDCGYNDLRRWVTSSGAGTSWKLTEQESHALNEFLKSQSLVRPGVRGENVVDRSTCGSLVVALTASLMSHPDRGDQSRGGPHGSAGAGGGGSGVGGGSAGAADGIAEEASPAYPLDVYVRSDFTGTLHVDHLLTKTYMEALVAAGAAAGVIGGDIARAMESGWQFARQYADRSRDLHAPWTVPLELRPGEELIVVCHGGRLFSSLGSHDSGSGRPRSESGGRDKAGDSDSEGQGSSSGDAKRHQKRRCGGGQCEDAVPVMTAFMYNAEEGRPWLMDVEKEMILRFNVTQDVIHPHNIESIAMYPGLDSLRGLVISSLHHGVCSFVSCHLGGFCWCLLPPKSRFSVRWCGNLVPYYFGLFFAGVLVQAPPSCLVEVQRLLTNASPMTSWWQP